MGVFLNRIWKVGEWDIGCWVGFLNGVCNMVMISVGINDMCEIVREG